MDADLHNLGLKVNYHEKNLASLSVEMNSISESIVDLQVKVGKWHVSHVHHGETSNDQRQMITVKHTTEKILQQQNTAAGILCLLKNFQLQASKVPWTKDVVGVVATLGNAKDDNLSRLLSEYLGPETMLAVVCKTLDGVKALEKYGEEGMIDKNAGLHGLGPLIGRHLDGRFLAISLENPRAYCGKFWADDPQKRLDLLKPILPDGKCPPGFLGFAVNMIVLDHNHLSYLTVKGHGLRETLFYNLFSRLQVYRSRTEMELAMPCISEGAISLDGGMIKANGIFYLGGSKDDIVRFPTTFSRSTASMEIHESQDQMKLLQWKKEQLAEDILREETLLKKVKGMYRTKQEEYEKILNDTHQDILKMANQEKTETRAKWNESHKAHLVKLLGDYNVPAYRSQNGWNKEAWNRILRDMVNKFPNINCTVIQVKGLEQEIKKIYKLLKGFSELSGFGWDYEKNMISATDDVWAPLLEKNKEARRWHQRPFPYFTALQEIYEGRHTEGKHSHDVDYYANIANVPMDTPSPSIPAPNDLIQSLSTPEIETEDRDFAQVEPPCTQPYISQPQSSCSEKRQGLGDDDMQRKKNDRKRKNVQEAFLEQYIDMRRSETDRYINAMKINQEEEKYTIGECMAAFNVVCDLFSDEDMVKATILFKDKDNREIFLNLKKDRKVLWLRQMID